MTNLSIALLSLAAFAIFIVWQWLKRESDKPYSEEPTEAGRKFMDDPNETDGWLR